MQQIIVTMPVIALRGLTVLPGMTVSFDISRAKSVAAVEKAMVSDQKVGLLHRRIRKIPILLWNSFIILEPLCGSSSW